MSSSGDMVVSLVDKFGRVHKYLRISLTNKCNLACNYCMPTSKLGASLPSLTPDLMTPSEISRIVKVFVHRCGVSKIRLTGGEPTVRRDFDDILDAIGELGVGKVGITTNGVLLHRHVDALTRNKVGLWNVSLDTLDRAKFPLISNRTEAHWDRTMEAIKTGVLLVNTGGIEKIKINTVAMKHVNDDEIVSLVELTRDWPVQVRFIEYMPFQGNSFSSKIFISKKDILQRIQLHYGDRVCAAQTDDVSASTGNDLWRINGYTGEFGIISSMTDNFCGSCDRLRLSADGKIRNCLFAKSSSEVSLLDVVRNGGSDDEIEELIRASVSVKKFAHGGNAGVEGILASKLDNRSMIDIGG